MSTSYYSQPAAANYNTPPVHAQQRRGYRICDQCGAVETPAVQRFRLCSGCMTTQYCSHECQRQNWPTHKAICQHAQASLASGKQQPVSTSPDEKMARDLRKFTSAHTTLLGWAGFQALQLKRIPSNIRQNALLVELTPRPSAVPHNRFSVLSTHIVPRKNIRDPLVLNDIQRREERCRHSGGIGTLIIIIQCGGISQVIPVEVDPPAKISWDVRKDWESVLHHFVDSGRTDFMPISTTSRGIYYGDSRQPFLFAGKRVEEEEEEEDGPEVVIPSASPTKMSCYSQPAATNYDAPPVHVQKQRGHRICDQCGAVETSAIQRFRLCGGCMTTQYCSLECQKQKWPFHKGICKHTQAPLTSANQQPVSTSSDENMAKALRKFTSAHTALLRAGFQAPQLKRLLSNIRQNAFLVELTPGPSAEPHLRSRSSIRSTCIELRGYIRELSIDLEERMKPPRHVFRPIWLSYLHHDWGGGLGEQQRTGRVLQNNRDRDIMIMADFIRWHWHWYWSWSWSWSSSSAGASSFQGASGFGISGSSFVICENSYTNNHYHYPGPGQTNNSGTSPDELLRQIQLERRMLEIERRIMQIERNMMSVERLVFNIERILQRIETRMAPEPDPPDICPYCDVFPCQCRPGHHHHRNTTYGDRYHPYASMHHNRPTGPRSRPYYSQSTYTRNSPS